MRQYQPSWQRKKGNRTLLLTYLIKVTFGTLPYQKVKPSKELLVSPLATYGEPAKFSHLNSSKYFLVIVISVT